MSWKAVHGIQAGSQGKQWGLQLELGMNFGAGSSSYQLWIFCGATHFEQSHGFPSKSHFCQKHSARVPPDRCFSTFVSGFALGGSCSMCFWSETWLLIPIVFQRLQLPKAKKPSWMLPQQACCLRRGDAEAVAFCRLAGGCGKGA